VVLIVTNIRWLNSIWIKRKFDDDDDDLNA